MKMLDMHTIEKIFVAVYVAPRSWIRIHGFARSMRRSLKNFQTKPSSFSMRKLRELLRLLQNQEDARRELVVILRGGFCSGYAISAMEKFGEQIKEFKSVIDREINKRNQRSRRRKRK